jgi:hypothetical protein
MGKKEYVGEESGILDYEFWTRRVGEHEGWEYEMRQIVEILYTNRQSLAASANTIVQTMSVEPYNVVSTTALLPSGSFV